jgi:hypothetical protein
MNTKLLLSFVLLAAACKPADDTDPVDDTTDTTDTTPVEPTCDETPGSICTWLGIPSVAMFASEGLNRLESATYLPLDGLYGPDGKFYFIDFNNHRIRRVESDDTVHTIAGSGFLGDGPQGPAATFAFNHPTDLAFHPLDDTKLYVAAWHNSRVNIVDLVTGNASFGAATGARSYGGDNGPASAAALDLPASVAFEDDGTYYVMDQANQLIRKVDPALTITTYAGIVETRNIDDDGNPDTPNVDRTKGWPGYAGDGGPALQARFHASVGQAADPSSRIALHNGWLYIADTENHLIRRIDLASGNIERFAGAVSEGSWDHDFNVSTPEIVETKGWPGTAGDGGDRLDAEFNGPRDLEVDDVGNVFIADTGNHCVRKIDTTGVVSTVAGQCGTPGFSGDFGPATDALLYKPYGVTLTPDGGLLIADTGNQVFRKVYP